MKKKNQTKKKLTKDTATHAPGPWKTDLDSRSDDSHVIVSASGKIVATVHATDIDDDDETQAENLASLRLIAAAPDMLTELRNVAEWLSTDLEAAEETGSTELDLATLHARIDPVISALAKATREGRSTT